METEMEMICLTAGGYMEHRTQRASCITHIDSASLQGILKSRWINSNTAQS